MQIFTSNSAEETENIGRCFGQKLAKNSVVCFFGDLGAGKTTFIRGLAEGANPDEEAHVNSPTFVYLNIYDGAKPVYHFDLYRLRDSDEFLSMGFDDYLSCGGICCIEWSERVSSLLPAKCIHVTMTHIAESVREITITP